MATLSLGRHTTAMYDIGVQYDPMGISTRYSIGVQDTAFQSRTDNSLKYVGKYGPVTAKLLYSFGADGTSGVNGEVPGNYKVGRAFGGSLAYESGPLALAVSTTNSTAIQWPPTTRRPGRPRWWVPTQSAR